MGQASEWAVVRFSDGWHVVSGQWRSGRFDYRVDAEEAALRLTATARKRGEPVRLLVQEANSQMRVLDQGNRSPAPG